VIVYGPVGPTQSRFMKQEGKTCCGFPFIIFWIGKVVKIIGKEILGSKGSSISLHFRSWELVGKWVRDLTGS
jgi:hypothetical protein